MLTASRGVRWAGVLLALGGMVAPAAAEYGPVHERMRENTVYVGCRVELLGSALIEASGSGFLIANSEYVVTNNHVISTCNPQNRGILLKSRLKEELKTQVKNGTLPEAISQELLAASPGVLERLRADPELADRYLNDRIEKIAAMQAQARSIAISQKLYVMVTGKADGAPVSVDVSAIVWNSEYSDPKAKATGVDVAVLRLSRPLADRPSLPFALGSSARVNDEVYAVGFPAASGEVVKSNKYEPSWTPGFVSKLGGEHPELTDAARAQGLKGASVIEITAAISEGSSGGPLYNAYGEVLGINTFGPIGRGSGIGWALDIAAVVPVLRDLGLPMPPLRSTPREWHEKNPGPVWGGAIGAGVVVLWGSAVLLRRRLGMGASPTSDKGRAGHGHPPAAAASRPGIVGRSGAFAGVAIPLPAGGLTLGRDPGKGRLVFEEGSDVSRMHCSIVWRADTGQFEVVDHGSRNGTFLPPQTTPLPPHQAVSCRRGQTVRVGAKNEFQLDLL